MKRITAVVLCFFVALSAVQGRQTPVVVPGGVFVPVGPVVESKSASLVAPVDGPGEPAAKAEGPVKPKDSPRLKKIQQLQFDRRPSTILKAWSAPLPRVSESADLHGPVGSPEKDPIDAELANFRLMVTLGNWRGVRAYLGSLDTDDAKAAYKQMLRSLQSPPHVPSPIPPQYRETNRFALDDVVALAAAAPHGLEKETLGNLGQIVRAAMAGGLVSETVVARLKAESAEAKPVLTPRQVAQVLLSAGLDSEVGSLLPSVERASHDKDLEALNLLARHFLALFAKDKKPAALDQAWQATQAILALEGSREEKEEALKRAVELAPRVKEQFGQAWLEASFTDKPQRGQDIIATLGSTVAAGLQANPRNADGRLKTLKLQKTAVDALIKAAPQRAKEWQSTLSLLAANWLKEADFSYHHARTPQAGPSMRRDTYGNVFWTREYMDEQPTYNRNPNMPIPVEAVDVLECRPDDAWLANTDDALKPQLSIVTAQLFLKVSEEAQAFPHIERMAAAYPEKGKELVNEFLRVWTRNHDPNSSRNYTNPYYYFYGFERRTESIPLTRSKQERNLVELAELVARLKKLPIGNPNQELLAAAFTTCHSSAEVYRTEAIERVFGPVGQLKADTLAGLANQMRENLAGLWRAPQNQTEKRTKRKQKDIQLEVVRGYQVAKTVLDGGLAKHPDEWSLVLAKAALLHDEANYHHEIEKDPKQSQRIAEAMGLFQKAHKLYAAKVRDLPENEQSTRVYELWYYAGLGSCDLERLNDEKLPDTKQFPLIREALAALPGEMAAKHLERFANQLFSRMSAVAPSCKSRYLNAGFEIVGNHKAAWEARKVYDYYKDLVTELKLDAVPDGSDAVGTKPFGVFVNLRHTREIERESGGFGRYLQNQNSGRMFYYNYGRPLTDYRDRFQAVVNEACKDNFDVLSVTFQTEKVTSRTDRDFGWRTTPYAYLLLKAKGPQVDKLPPLRLDLDFLDTSGYVILPLESPARPVDAGSKPAARPSRKVKVTQILDERKAPEGKLVLEVKATALGLVGELDSLVDLTFDGFKVLKTDDPGVSVSKFDDDTDASQVLSERNWVVTLGASGDTRPATFRFPPAKAEFDEMVLQRYADADLVAAQPTVTLGEALAKPARPWLWAGWTAAGALALVTLAALTLWLLRRRPKAEVGLVIPEPLTPFSLIGFLENVERVNGLSADRSAQLRATIRDVEQHYFADSANGDAPDLRRIAEAWIR